MENDEDEDEEEEESEEEDEEKEEEKRGRRLIQQTITFQNQQQKVCICGKFKIHLKITFL